MKRTAALFSMLCFFALAAVQVTSAQQIPNIAGNWSATTRMPDRSVSDQWTIQQAGGRVTGTVKSAHGDLQVVGTVDEVGFFRVTFKDGDVQYKVRATLDKDSMDGSIVIGNKEYLWSAKRSK